MEIIVGKTAGFCYGVKRAVEGAKKELSESNEKVYCLGEIVHNKQVVKQLEENGLIFIEDIKSSKAKTILRAHGVKKEVYEIAKEKGIEIKDYTCPNVLRIHEIAEKYSEMGYYIILCGNKEHPENIGTLSHCGKNYSVIEEEIQLEEILNKIEIEKIKNILLISQTTYSFKKFKIIEEKIKKALSKEIILSVKNTICRATELRQKETEEISKKVDYMIIIGGRNSSNTRKLYEIANKNCMNCVCIETVKELEISNLVQYSKIGIMAGASTPKESISEVVKKIEEIVK